MLRVLGPTCVIVFARHACCGSALTPGQEGGCPRGLDRRQVPAVACGKVPDVPGGTKATAARAGGRKRPERQAALPQTFARVSRS